MITDNLAALGSFGRFAGRVLVRAATPPWAPGDIAHHVLLLATRCALPVTAVVAPAGMVLALQGLMVFEQFGAQRMLSSLVVVAVIRELSPVLASMLVAAQGGSAFAAELGAMRVREELDATEVMAIDGVRVHAVPRVIAATVATPLLDLLGTVAGVLGAWLIAVPVQGEPNGPFWANLWGLARPGDLAGSLFKTAVFGLLIGLVATWKGWHATGGAAGVGRAVNATVVVAVTASIVANYFLTSMLLGLAP